MKNIKITNDGFVWDLIEKEQMQQAYENNIDVYLLHGDDSESLITEEEVDDNDLIGAELGQLSELRSNWQEACERNNETRSFDAWLEDKAENLIN